MEEHYKYIGDITEEESKEIEFTIERHAGLQELLLICEDNLLEDNIKREIAALEESKETWWQKIKKNYKWSIATNVRWAIDYQENKVWIQSH